jgi:hypothetical protein
MVEGRSEALKEDPMSDTLKVTDEEIETRFRSGSSTLQDPDTRDADADDGDATDMTDGDAADAPDRDAADATDVDAEDA